MPEYIIEESNLGEQVIEEIQKAYIVKSQSLEKFAVPYLECGGKVLRDAALASD